MKTALIIALILLAGGVVFMTLIAPIIASIFIFRAVFVRTSPDKWARDKTDDIEEKRKMHAAGKAWRKAHLDRMKEVSVERDGLRFFGEFYDFGSDRAVMILLGRSECFYDAFCFAAPYVDRGFSVLAVDSRAHGISDGKYHTFGFEESGDYLEWARYLHDELSVDHIVLHGICVGAAAGVFALTSGNCPTYVDALVAEGLHTRLWETTKNHVKENRKPTHPVLDLIDLWQRVFTGHSMRRGPADFIDRLTAPLLMLHGKKDRYALAEDAKLMFDKCPSERKRLVLFDEGEHSRLWVKTPGKYEDAVKAFLDELYEQRR